MTSKTFFQYTAFAAVAGSVVALILVAAQLAEQFADLATDYAAGICRLLP